MRNRTPRHSRQSEFDGRRADYLDRKAAQSATSPQSDGVMDWAPVQDETEVKFLDAVFTALRVQLGDVIKQGAADRYWGSGDDRYNLVVAFGGRELKVLVTTDPTTKATVLLFVSRDNINLTGGATGTEWVKTNVLAVALADLQRKVNTAGTRTSAPSLLELLKLPDDEPVAAPARVLSLEELLTA